LSRVFPSFGWFVFTDADGRRSVKILCRDVSIQTHKERAGATPGDVVAFLFLGPFRPIREYYEMIYFFGEEYVKKVLGCQGGIETDSTGILN
jgi:hypothetical protein